MDRYFVKELCNYYINNNIVFISNKYDSRWFKIPIEIFNLLCTSQEEKKSIYDLHNYIVNEDDREYYNQIIKRLNIIGVLCSKPTYKIERNEIPKILISLTNKCNLKCDYCCADSKLKNNKDMNLKEIKNMLNKIVSLSPLKIALTGGEPMLRNDFFEILKYLRSIYKGRIQLETNATYINEHNIKELSKYIHAYDISLDGYDEKSCSKVRGKGVFGKVIKNIHLIHESGCRNINLSMVFGKNNANEVHKFKSFCKSISVNPIVRPFTNMGRGTLNANKYLDNLNDIIFYTPLNHTEGTDFDEAIKCRCGERQLFVNYDGNIYPCPLLQSQEYLICDVENLTDKMINTILHCDYEVLKKIDNLRTVNYEKCKECKYSLFCNNCLAIMHMITKNNKIFEHNCKIMKNRFELQEKFI